MATTVRKYNPGFLTDDELVASFCVRTHEFDSMIEMLRECTGSANPHRIVIGPRGSGKTLLLLRLAVELHRDADLASRFFPITFAEESYEVATAGEFWLEALSRLAAQASNRHDAEALRRSWADLCMLRDDRALGDRCLGALMDFADCAGKRLVLLVENLNMMFADMADPDEAGWRLRKVLQTEPRIVLVASATSRFDAIDKPDKALYDLFRILTLRPLDTNECATLWESVSGQRRAPDTIRALRILTGGSPRLLTILARFGAGLSFRDLMEDLLQLVDDHTEYFKSHLETLPAQERRVYLALADLWKPATAREIADRARLDTSKCSAQLARLADRGAIEVVGGAPRRKLYYLTERLYNIYYLMRRAHGSEPLVEALVRFMASNYAPAELKDIGLGIAREAGELDTATRLLHRTAFKQLVALPAYDEALRRHEEVHPASDSESVAKALAGKGALLGIELGRTAEALAVYEEVVRRFGTSEEPAILPTVDLAFFAKGVLLSILNRPAETLAAWDDVIRRLERREAPGDLELFSAALDGRGTALLRLQRLEEALAAWDDVVHRFDASDVPALREVVGSALLQSADVELGLQRYGQAVVTAGRALERFATESPEERCRCHLIRAKAMLASGDRTAGEQDVAAMLAIFPDLIIPQREILDGLKRVSVAVGMQRMRELIVASPAAELLLPLTTALERELGIKPRVAREVAEVAEDIRRDFLKLREGRTDADLMR